MPRASTGGVIAVGVVAGVVAAVAVVVGVDGPIRPAVRVSRGIGRARAGVPRAPGGRDVAAAAWTSAPRAATVAAATEGPAMRDFAGRTVAITGAASGIGRAAAAAFAVRGAHLALADIDAAGLARGADELRAAGRRVLARPLDVARAEDVARFRDEAYGVFGRVDVLCNVAGIAINGLLEDMQLEDWRRIVDVDLWGVIHGCHFFYPAMIRQGGGGHIVNVASMAALGPLPASTAYGAVKSAVLGLSASLRLEAARHGIGVTVVCPGVVATGMGRALRMVSGARGRSAEETRDAIGRMMTRFGARPERVAEAIVRAVETDAGVVPVGPEAAALDLLHRGNRRVYDAVMTGVLRAILADR